MCLLYTGHESHLLMAQTCCYLDRWVAAGIQVLEQQRKGLLDVDFDSFGLAIYLRTCGDTFGYVTEQTTFSAVDKQLYRSFDQAVVDWQKINLHVALNLPQLLAR